jgi:hypothetical protein
MTGVGRLERAPLPGASSRVNEFETFRTVGDVLEDRVLDRESSWIGRERGEGFFADTAVTVRVRMILEYSLLNPAEDLFEVEFGGRFVYH